ncbi:MAG: hypothetical protein ABIT58_06185 [Ferruginibacter sp.]
MKLILSVHKLKVQISLLQRTSMAYAQSQATKLCANETFYTPGPWWGILERIHFGPLKNLGTGIKNTLMML